MGERYHIEVGRRFGNLVVLKEVQAIHFVKNKYPFRRVLCQCDCGNNKEVDYCNLVNGSTQSCGCQKGQKLSQLQRKNNQYDLSGECGIGYMSDGQEFLFDIEDYDIIKKYCWYRSANGYVVANTYIEDDKKTIILIHRLILGLEECDNNTIDHEDRNPLNNRKSNLRITTQQNNCKNKSKDKRNKSGITGVDWRKDKKRWRASICVNYKTIYLGGFINKDEAIKARLRAEKEYFGEFAPQKELFEQYEI